MMKAPSRSGPRAETPTVIEDPMPLPIRVVSKSEPRTVEGALDQKMIITGHDHNLRDNVTLCHCLGHRFDERSAANVDEKLIVCAEVTDDPAANRTALIFVIRALRARS
jgi:hypothetical protein